MAVTEVILKEKVDGVGAEADIVKVKAGFARNFLIPKGIAYEATEHNVQHIELAEFKEIAAKLNGTDIKLDLEIGENDKAFGAITNIDIHKALEAKGFNIDRHAIVLEKPIKKTTDTEVEVKLHSEVAATITVKVNPVTKA